MSAQTEFIKKMAELIELAEEQGNVITEEQLAEIIPETAVDEEKKKVITDYLKEKRIGINERIDAEEFMTEDEKNYLDFYIEDIKGSIDLTPGEREVFRKNAIAGDDSAAEIVLKDYLMNVIEIAKLYAGQGVMIEDLIGEANIALLLALPGLGALEDANEVDGFFGKIVMDSMQDTIAARMDELTEGEKMVKKVEKVSRAAQNLANLLGRKVTVEELAQESKMSENYIISALKLCGNKIEEIEIPEELK